MQVHGAEEAIPGADHPMLAHQGAYTETCGVILKIVDKKVDDFGWE